MSFIRTSYSAPSLRPLTEPRQGGFQPLYPRHGLGAPLALFLDHLGWGLGHELLIAELLVDLADLGFFLADLAVEPGTFGVEIDHAGQRQRQRRLAHHQLRRT